MSPTVFRWRRCRFFFSREETRVQVHVSCPDGEAKFWLEAEVSVATNYGLSEAQVSRLRKVAEDRKDEIIRSWYEHFRGGSR